MRFIFLMLVSILGLNQSNTIEETQVFPFKSGSIVYKLEGRTNGTESIFFDDFGKLISSLKIIKTSKIAGQYSYDTIQTILRNDTVYKINYSNKTINKGHSFTELNKTISRQTLKDLGFSKTSSEVVAGFDSDIYSGANGNLWLWNNIVMKSEMIVLDTKIVSEATEILIGISIPQSKFVIPENFIINNK